MADTEISKDIQQKHPRYQTISSEAQKMAAMYRADSTFLSSTYISRHVFESTAQYESRVGRAFTIPFMRGIIKDCLNVLFNSGVIRTGADLAALQTFLDDCTGTDIGLNQYMAAVAGCTLLCGQAHTFVDYSFTDSDAVKAITGSPDSIDGTSDSSIMPTVRMFIPGEMLNWSYIPRKGYEACLFQVTRIIDKKEDKGFLYVDYDSIVEYDSGGKTIGSPYTHNLGYTPVFTTSCIGALGTHEGFVAALQSVQSATANLCSIVDEISERHAFSQLVCPDDGTFAELEAKESSYLRLYTRANPAAASAINDGTGNTGSDMVLRKLANSSIFTFPAGTGHPPSFISPEATQLETIWSICAKAIAEAKATLGIYDSAGKVDKQAIGTLFKDFTPALALHEKRVLRAAGTYIGSPVADIAISYRTKEAPPDTEWLDVADRIAASEWLSAEARTIIVQDMARLNVEDLGVSMGSYESIINGIAVKDAATLEGDKAAAIAASAPAIASDKSA